MLNPSYVALIQYVLEASEGSIGRANINLPLFFQHFHVDCNYMKISDFPMNTLSYKQQQSSSSKNIRVVWFLRQTVRPIFEITFHLLRKWTQACSHIQTKLVILNVSKSTMAIFRIYHKWPPISYFYISGKGLSQISGHFQFSFDFRSQSFWIAIAVVNMETTERIN